MCRVASVAYYFGFQVNMGSSESRLADLSSNEYVQKFVGKEIIAPNDPFWEQFLSFTFIPPKSA